MNPRYILTSVFVFIWGIVGFFTYLLLNLVAGYACFNKKCTDTTTIWQNLPWFYNLILFTVGLPGLVANYLEKFILGSFSSLIPYWAYIKVGSLIFTILILITIINFLVAKFTKS